MAAIRSHEEDDPDDPDMPSEFPERWSRFLPPEDVTGRFRTHAKSSPKGHGGNGGSGEEQPPER